jgi:DNA topoisomerase-2
MLLINGSDGTGNGYASTVLQYDAKDVKTAVEEVLKTGVVQTPLTPFLKGYYGAISKDHASGQVVFEGQIERVGANKIIIHELTPNRQLADYKAILNALVIDKTGPNKDLPPFIKDYDNESTEDEWKFVLDVPRSTMQLSDEELLVKLKLIERQTENLTVWLPSGKLKRFSSVEMLIQEWVELRLRYYEVRRLDQIERLKVELDWLNTKAAFIRWWNKNSSELVTLKKDALRTAIVVHVTKNEDQIALLLNIRISNLGLEEVEALTKEIEKVEVKVKTLESTTNKKMMSSEVKALKLD